MARIRRSRVAVLALAVLPGMAVVLGVAAGVLQWQRVSDRRTAAAVGESVQAARTAAARILSYRADTVERDFAAARSDLTGPFLDSYTELVNTSVIPAARQRQISAVAEVVGAASVSAAPEHAVALVFVNQTTTAGSGASTIYPSTVRVTLDKIGGRWLVSGFDPV